MAVPNIFGTATAAIPLSQLDSNFATTITLGNTAIQLGNTVTTLNNMTLANVTVSSGSVTLTNVAVTTANVTTANITTAVIGTATITTAGITTANVTTANIVTAVITTANVTTANVSTALSYSGTLTGGTGIVNLGSGQFYKDATGNVGIGTNSPQAKLTVNGALPAASSPATYAGTIQINETALSTLQDTGGLEFRGAVFGSGYGNKITSTDTGDLLFGGRLNSASWTERMRIDSSGNLLVGTTSNATYSEKFNITTGSDTQVIMNLVATGTSAFGAVKFRNGSGEIGSISYLSSAVIYNTTSDYRLKTVVGAVSNSGERIDALKPIDYQWKEGGQQARGFLAHEFQKVYPNSVTGTKDAVGADGKPEYQAMQASSSEVIADLVAEIQSLRIRLAALEAA